jgi:hypothetical protein
MAKNRLLGMRCEYTYKEGRTPSYVDPVDARVTRTVVVEFVQFSGAFAVVMLPDRKLRAVPVDSLRVLDTNRLDSE